MHIVPGRAKCEDVRVQSKLQWRVQGVGVDRNMDCSLRKVTKSGANQREAMSAVNGLARGVGLPKP
jgi:hypothetical protein